MKEIINQAQQLLDKIEQAKKWLHIEDKQTKLKSLANEMNQTGFWAQPDKAAQLSKQAAELEEEISIWQNLEKQTQEVLSLARASLNEDDNSIHDELINKLNQIKRTFSSLEFKIMLAGPYDKQPAVLAIHAGTGGTDAQDWAEMLERMYLRYAEKKNFQVIILDRQSGQEAGIKTVVMEIKGPFAYGYLKAEAGVHRLVRISPFDAEKMRHTSFALVEVLPELAEVEDIEIKDEDLHIETFKSSGHGGQSVNTTDSAVRIRHLPTGITVTCRNERSQLQNKQTALKILKSKLKQYEQAEREEEKKKKRGEFSEAAWGNQARSYVLHPYKLVKDHRSGFETQEVDKVLDGELDPLIEAYLKSKK